MLQNDKQKLLEKAQNLSDRYNEIKETIIKLLDDLDRIELEFNDTVELIKKN